MKLEFVDTRDGTKTEFELDERWDPGAHGGPVRVQGAAWQWLVDRLWQVTIAAREQQPKVIEPGA